MKKIFAVVVVFGFVVGFAGCGTEDDPTLNPDSEIQDNNELSPAPAPRCQVVRGVLSGACIDVVGCFLRRSTSPSCPVGAVPLRLSTACGGFDYNRVCQ